ncbi:MAG: imidazole glycerol phosphate synthase subunit HisH [Mariniphaga sp.]|nr:imidazole glycerol phosphate synthase subunit HisH [Mariniphaga sp.]
MITIVNYGLGNIRAFANVYKNLNIETKIANSESDLQDATKIILPGVGAFDYAMQLLNDSGMRDSLDNLVLSKKILVLGICVGMQILANSSEEGISRGLGWIDGEVKKMETSNLSFQTQLPHMGWNSITQGNGHPLVNNLKENPRFYFLHSYYFSCNKNINSIAESQYGNSFTCAVNSNNVYGVQFHPEKSHQNGIQILKNFAVM